MAGSRDRVSWKRVLSQVKERLRAGAYPPNSYLPAERVLAEEFGVTRACIRRVMAEIAREGLVEQCPGRGTRIRAPEEHSPRQRVAVLHSPRKSWITGEGHLIIHGIFEGLDAMGIDYDRIPWSPCPMPDQGEDVNTICRAERIPEIADRYAGLLFLEATSPPLQAPLRALLDARRVPVVVANYERRDLDVHCTCVDHGSVAERAVGTLIRFGHRRIAYMGLSPALLFYAELLAGFRRGCRNAGIQTDPAHEVFLEGARPFQALAATEPLLDGPERPTAIFLGRDWMGQAVVEAMQTRGLQPGRDISLIGYDDVTWPDPDPILTTFHEPCYELGYEAARILHELLTKGWRPPERRVLDTPLVLRRSAGPPPVEVSVAAPLSAPS